MPLRCAPPAWERDAVGFGLYREIERVDEASVALQAIVSAGPVETWLTKAMQPHDDPYAVAPEEHSNVWRSDGMALDAGERSCRSMRAEGLSHRTSFHPGSGWSRRAATTPYATLARSLGNPARPV